MGKIMPITAALASMLAASAGSAADVAETEIAAGALKGLYRDAGDAAPTVIIVPGSGPTDRNGDNPLGVKAAPYRLLAEALSTAGVSSVRVDKRGLFSSAAAGDPNAVTIDIYANDYRAWIDAVRERTGAPCVFLLGHSEGALMVSAAATGRDDVCGLILVSGVGRSFGDVLREQLQANPANVIILDDAFRAIDALEAGESIDVSAMHPALQQLFNPAVQPFLISLVGSDPAAVAAEANVPTLIVHGANDIQTSVADAERLAEATGGELVIVDGVNHVLKESPADRAGNLATYADPDLPIAPGVVEAIVGFVEKNAR